MNKNENRLNSDLYIFRFVLKMVLEVDPSLKEAASRRKGEFKI
jgi:hypothetical protein